MLGFFTFEASKGDNKDKYHIERSKTMDKYALMKRCHYDRRLQFYMYFPPFFTGVSVPIS